MLNLTSSTRTNDFVFNKTTRRFLKKLNDKELPTIYDMIDAFTEGCESDGASVEVVLGKEGVRTYDEFVHFLIGATLARKHGLIYDRN